MSLTITGPTTQQQVAGAYEQTVSAPSTTVTLVYGLTIVPAGVLCTETGGENIVEPATVTNPTTGTTVVTFGVPFTGTINLS